MTRMMPSIAALSLILTLFAPGETPAQVSTGGDVLSEVPLWPVPAEMTLEEYTDANRRLSVGLALMSVPIPGSLHFYAGESRKGWMHVGAATLGAVSVIAGAALIDEKDTWESSDYEVVDVTAQDGEVQRYEKIPTEEEGGVFTYRLRQVDHKMEGAAGAAFVVAGAGLLVGQLLYDWIDGIRTIERKRNAVRYKYGRLASCGLSLRPSGDVRSGRFGAELALRF